MSDLTQKMRVEFGTGEWSDYSRNCMIGCSNDCAYCYARANAIKHGVVDNRAAWPVERVDEREAQRHHNKVNGLMMFPTRHDVTPTNLKYTLPYLTKLLEAGNEVLLVSKASLACMQEICRELDLFKSQLLIRVTIGSMHPMICKFWERNSPPPQERLEALQYALDQKFETSVSMEPFLNGVDDAIATFRAVEPYVSETIWIGAMNSVTTRVDMSNQNLKRAAADIRLLQAKCELGRLYEALKDEPKVRWKESIGQAVGLK